jgi:hypothetical protein
VTFDERIASFKPDCLCEVSTFLFLQGNRDVDGVDEIDT